MTKLESYMVDGEFSATQFYADVDGHPEDKGLAFALEELKFFSREFRIVGVYPAAIPRVHGRTYPSRPRTQDLTEQLRRAPSLFVPTSSHVRRDDTIYAAAFFAQPERIREQAIRFLARVVVVHRRDDHQFIRLACRDHRLAASP
jgi:hypothetical protein